MFYEKIAFAALPHTKSLTAVNKASGGSKLESLGVGLELGHYPSMLKGRPFDSIFK